MTEASVSSGARNLKIVFKCTTNDPAQMVLVGDADALGNWNPSAGVVMNRQDRPIGGYEWTTQVELPLGSTVEYKFVTRTGETFRWEGGNNHRFTAIPGISTLQDAFRE